MFWPISDIAATSAVHIYIEIHAYPYVVLDGDASRDPLKWNRTLVASVSMLLFVQFVVRSPFDFVSRKYADSSLFPLCHRSRDDPKRVRPMGPSLFLG